MKISTDLLQSLKKQTGAGLKDCKQALEKFDGDLVAASEHLKKNGRDIVYYYSLYQANGDWLLEDDDAYKVIREVSEYLDETKETGRLDIKNARVGLIADLEGAYPDYGHNEIQESIETAKSSRFDSGSDTLLIQESFLSCLEQQGITEYRAYPITLFHEATGREWPDFWYVFLTFPALAKSCYRTIRKKFSLMMSS